MKHLRKILAGLVIFSAIVPVRAQKYKGLVDKVVSVVGDEAIMLSDVESEVKVMKAQTGVSDVNARCAVLEQILQSKLFLMQARLDSLNVNQDMVQAQVEQRIDYFRMALGGDDAVEEYMGKSLYKLRKEWRKQAEEMSLMQQEQQQIASHMPEITPYDVDTFLDTVDVSGLPIIPIKYQISQICVYPDREAAAMACKEKLLALRERIIAGDRFSTLARLYSDDPGSAVKGGELGMAKADMFHAEFSDAAMALKPGMVSQIVETSDGFHLIQVIEKKGDMFNARHILIKPKYTSEDRVKGFATLDSLRTKILDSTITFELAAKIYSQDQPTRTNGGQMADPQTGAAYFEVDRMKPQDYNAVKDLHPGEISQPIESLDNEGIRGGNTVYKIVRLDKILPSHIATKERDYAELQSSVSQIKEQEAIRKFVKEKIKVTFIRIDPMFRDCEFDEPEWQKKVE